MEGKKIAAYVVLILVLMEDGLREDERDDVLEETLRSLNTCFNGRWSARGMVCGVVMFILIRLNPCFNGRWSARDSGKYVIPELIGLNPCFNGRWSARGYSYSLEQWIEIVLILVLMEDGLRVEPDNSF